MFGVKFATTLYGFTNFYSGGPKIDEAVGSADQGCSLTIQPAAFMIQGGNSKPRQLLQNVDSSVAPAGKHTPPRDSHH